jgi:hypothetical protein
MNHFNLLGAVPDVRDPVAWHNRVQDVALDTALGHPGDDVDRPTALL